MRCFGDAEGLGELFGFGFFEGLGDGDATFSSGEGVADSSGEGVGEVSARRFGDAEGVGELFAFGFAEGLGDGDEIFFFVDVVLR